jgi:hypothetical protein
VVAYSSLVTFALPKQVEEDLELLAKKQGRAVDELLEEAVTLYIQASAITDTTPEDVAATQEVLIGELKNLPDWQA